MAAVVVMTFFVAGVPAGAQPTKEDIVASKELRQAVTVQGMVEHLKRLHEIGQRHDDTRASGTSGYDASARYVARQLKRAGYDVTSQRFTFDFFAELSPPVFEQTSPESVTYEEGVDFATMDFSGSGDVTAELVAVDLTLPPTTETSSTSGCEPEDFPAEVEGNIALIQRGTCFFRDKVDNAIAAGAVGVVIFNEGNPSDPTRIELLSGTLDPPAVDIPVIGTTFALGEALSNGTTSGPTGITVHLATETLAEERETRNVIAETSGGDPSNVVMAGAHLDSVVAGPGINDNGSGTAGVLETALQMARLDIETEDKVRFAFWGAEENGLIGSTYYVENLSRSERRAIDLYLNFDMIGSPNFVRLIYDGDGSAFGIAGPEGSAGIEETFAAYFEHKGLATGETAFDGRSDYQAFIDRGIPAGALFTGAEGIKTPEEEQIYGGEAGVAYDPCYHQACDVLSNVNRKVLHQMADAIAHTVLTFAEG
jgi:Zn-dependent M28 family amino/carboxypeptidase